MSGPSAPDGGDILEGTPSSAGGRRAAKIFVAVFVATMIATFFFANMLTRGVRGNAVRTDREVRIVAWAILVHVDRTGAFPTARASMDDPFADTIAADGATPPRWPATIDGAGVVVDAADWRGELDAALDRLEVQFPPDGRLPPNVTPAGHPTELGTLAEVNGWLRGRADAMAAGPR